MTRLHQCAPYPTSHQQQTTSPSPTSSHHSLISKKITTPPAMPRTSRRQLLKRSIHLAINKKNHTAHTNFSTFAFVKKKIMKVYSYFGVCKQSQCIKSNNQRLEQMIIMMMIIHLRLRSPCIFCCLQRWSTTWPLQSQSSWCYSDVIYVKYVKLVSIVLKKL